MNAAGPDPRREALDTEILAWMREDPRMDRAPTAAEEARFDELARRLFRHQYEHCTPYARFCDARGVMPDTAGSWRDVPAVPAGAFKEVALRSFPPERCAKTFRTSGTSTARRGELHLDTLALYEASLLPTLRRLLFPDLERGETIAIRILAPAPAEAPDSSLSHMFGCLVDALGSDASGFDVRGGELVVPGLEQALESAQRDRRPVAVCGTAFAFVHLLEDLAGRSVAFRLPDGSRVMETGGFKGRSREMPRERLYGEIEARLGVPAARIVNQYGMTELGSQFYDSNLARPGELRRKLGPPWARVRTLDPKTGADAVPGEVGVLTIHDLANTGSVAAIATADLGRAIGLDLEAPGFEVLGREAGAEERGCSIAADLMLGE